MKEVCICIYIYIYIYIYTFIYMDNGRKILELDGKCEMW